jgi:hypothetical protein
MVLGLLRARQVLSVGKIKKLLCSVTISSLIIEMTDTSISEDAGSSEHASEMPWVRILLLAPVSAHTTKHVMSSLVCGLDVHKNSVYATAMSYGGEVIERRKLSNSEVID